MNVINTWNVLYQIEITMEFIETFFIVKNEASFLNTCAHDLDKIRSNHLELKF